MRGSWRHESYAHGGDVPSPPWPTEVQPRALYSQSSGSGGYGNLGSREPGGVAGDRARARAAAMEAEDARCRSGDPHRSCRSRMDRVPNGQRWDGGPHSYAFEEYGNDRPRPRCPAVHSDSSLERIIRRRRGAPLQEVLHPASFPPEALQDGRRGMRDQEAFRCAAAEFMFLLDDLRSLGWVGTRNDDPGIYARDRFDGEGYPWDERDDWYRYEQDQLSHWDPWRVENDWVVLRKYLSTHHKVAGFLAELNWMGKGDVLHRDPDPSYKRR